MRVDDAGRIWTLSTIPVEVVSAEEGRYLTDTVIEIITSNGELLATHRSSGLLASWIGGSQAFLYSADPEFELVAEVVSVRLKQ